MAVPAELVAAVDALAEVGIEGPDAGWSDEHDRWSVYLAVLERPDLRKHLFPLLALEPVREIGVGIVLRVAELDAGSHADRWISGLAEPEGRPYAARRLTEVRLLARLEQVAVAADLRALLDAIDWAQRRASERSSSPTVLDGLATREQGHAAKSHR